MTGAGLGAINSYQCYNHFRDSCDAGYGVSDWFYALLDTAGVAGGLTALPKLAGRPGDKWSRIPKSLMDEMVLDAAKRGKGDPLWNVELNDPRFKGMEKWSYGEKSAKGLNSEVHYVRDPITGELMDFKFKHHAETYN